MFVIRTDVNSGGLICLITCRLRDLKCVLSTLLRSYLRSDRTQGGGRKRLKRSFSGRASASPGCAAPNPGKGLRAGSPRPCTLCTPEWNSGRYFRSLLYYVSRSMLRKGLGLMRSIPAWKYLIGIFAVVWVVLAIMLFISDIPFYVIT